MAGGHDRRREGPLRSGRMIELRHVRKVFEGSSAPAVGDLSLVVPEGAVATLVGPSGCGKSTTLRMINRLVEPTSGQILVGGRDVTEQEPHELRRGIGYVIQQIGLFPHRTVAQNIATVPDLLGWDRARTRRRVGELLELVGLEPSLAGRYPRELSGGQQQRAGVARALAADPPVLLMDEPFGAVDPLVRARLQDELVVLQRELRKTIVFVTHDIDEAIRLGDRMAVLDVGGVLAQYGPPAEVLAAPANEFVARFLGSERGLKRLALLPVSSAELYRGPVVDLSASADDVRSTMQRTATTWVAVLDGDRLRGWLPAASVDSSIDPAHLRRFAVSLHPTSTRREALDALVSSPTRVAVVVDDDDRYLGMLDVDRIVAGLDAEDEGQAA
jgi:osmoprotectant transport system ATP-binding protein